MALFKRNLSTLDRIFRGVIGVCVTAYGVFFGQAIGDWILQSLVIVFGILNIISFASGWCVVYQIAGLQTCPKEEK